MLTFKLQAVFFLHQIVSSVFQRNQIMERKRMMIVFLLFVKCCCYGASAKFSARFPQKAASSDWRITLNTAPASHASSIYEFETFFFTQVLDHFSFLPSGSNTFQQRYLLNTQNWGGAERKAPILVYCGNEGDIEWFANNTGFVWELSAYLKAMLVFPEHRYYGRSIPDMALKEQTARTLAYLTSEQAIADYATLILDLKKNYSAEGSPVVAFGGSYGGMLAAWFRLKYPHVVIGALSSSAPILQFDNIVPSDSFMRIASQDYKNASSTCFEVIKNSWHALRAEARKPEGLDYLIRQFGFCGNLSIHESSIEDFLSDAWIYSAMTDYPYPSNFLMPLPANPVREICKAIDNQSNNTDIISRVIAGASIYYNGTGQTECYNPNADPHGMDLWNWQACTEMIMPMSSNPENSMFPPYTFELEETVRSCKNIYGIFPRPHWVVEEFGGHDIRTVLRHFASNIIFFNGLLDPWSGGGLLEDVSESIIAIVAPEGAHHVDLRASTKYDPGWLVAVRKKETQYIEDWLLQYYMDWNATHSAQSVAA